MKIERLPEVLFTEHWVRLFDAVVTSGREILLAPGVSGLAVRTPTGIYIPLMRALNPRSGEVSAFLDDLPHDYRVVFPSVINPHVKGALRRRRFVPTVEDICEVWEREAGK